MSKVFIKMHTISETSVEIKRNILIGIFSIFMIAMHDRKLQIHDSLIKFNLHSDIIVYDNVTNSLIKQFNLLNPLLAFKMRSRKIVIQSIC